MISALNYKPYNKGSISGFMDLQVGILTIKGAKLMAGKDGDQMWVALPQMPSIDDEGNKKYHEIIHVTAPVREHIRQAVILDLREQGHIEPDRSEPRRPSRSKQTNKPEDLSEHLPGSQDDIGVPF